MSDEKKSMTEGEVTPSETKSGSSDMQRRIKIGSQREEEKKPAANESLSTAKPKTVEAPSAPEPTTALESVDETPETQPAAATPETVADESRPAAAGPDVNERAARSARARRLARTRRPPTVALRARNP